MSDFVDRGEVGYGNEVPIEIETCEVCSLVQSKHTAPSDLLYTGHYWYKSGTTDTMRRALQEVADAAVVISNIQVNEFVLDVGSNDGTLLRCYPNNVQKIGVEPATNLIEEGRKGAHCVVNSLWSYGALQSAGLDGIKFKIVTALGMFYDLEDPNQFIRDVSQVLHPEGVFVAQLMCLQNMLELRDVGNLAHEHLEFYSLKSLIYLLERYDMEIRGLETNAVNGQSYRLWVTHRSAKLEMPKRLRENLLDAIDREHTRDVSNPMILQKWFAKLEETRNRCVEFVNKVLAEGKKVWVYGASTKGNVILQFYGLGRDQIQFAADRDPTKWGKWTIGSGIPITSEEQFRASSPDFALVLPYAFLPEFIEREAEWQSRGGKFIVPLPEFRVV